MRRTGKPRESSGTARGAEAEAIVTTGTPAWGQRILRRSESERGCTIAHFRLSVVSTACNKEYTSVFQLFALFLLSLCFGLLPLPLPLPLPFLLALLALLALLPALLTLLTYC